MELSEFKAGILTLRGAYGDRVFPKEREMVLWNRYQAAAGGAFKSAVETIVLRMPQPAAILEWLDDKIGVGEKPSPYGSPFACEPCRDFGYGFNGDTVARCSCDRGRRISPAELARQQGNYDRGGGLVRGLGTSPFPRLPYDPKERQGA